MPLYHYAPVRLSAGSIIEPGNWGRVLKRYNMNGFGNPWLIARELIFETARLQLFPDKPSRLSSCFALLTLEEATAYQAANDPNYISVLHEVELVEEEASQHTGALVHLNWPANGMAFVDQTRLNAAKYWEAEGDGERELLTASALRVVAGV
ncbi:hypothetical protein FHT77_000931 [Rhizobium sp. BK181]|uniref:DUF2441 domain-containing protein n=1 Tax=Rhizobium sp. BK181 TaxID=2587072 RepID=UPI00161FDBDB|nr:DUF2441 domain-containing protein [Rhizobium sp. BK181]MBB3315089.1 hypothetical protein [Rhizobium sp. BK181]